MSEKKRNMSEKKKAKHLQDSLISHLPNEILTLIFTEVNAEPLSISRDKHGKAKQEDSDLLENVGYLCMAVVISHVCGQWRTLSLGLPALQWTTFYHVSYLSKQHDILPRLDAFLWRSTSHLLDIWIDYRGTKASSKALEKMMTAVIGHVHRWRSFILFHNTTFPFLEFVKRLENVAAPNIETFCIPVAVEADKIPSSYLTGSTTASSIPTSPRIFKKGAPKLSLAGLDMLGLQFYLPSLSNLASLHSINSAGNEGVIIHAFNGPPYKSHFGSNIQQRVAL